MFDRGITRLIEGYDIDTPRNAISLTQDLHDLFGNFDIFFDPVPDQPPHTYRIQSLSPSQLVSPHVPVTRTLYLTENRTIDPPSPRFLAVHRAIAHILHLSAAGWYINQILQDREEPTQEDGSTEIARLVKLGLGGWAGGESIQV